MAKKISLESGNRLFCFGLRLDSTSITAKAYLQTHFYSWYLLQVAELFKATESLQMIYNQQAVHQLSGFVSLPKLSNDRKGADQWSGCHWNQMQGSVSAAPLLQLILPNLYNRHCCWSWVRDVSKVLAEKKISSSQSQRHSSLNTASFSTFSKWSNPLVVVDHPT